MATDRSSLRMRAVTLAASRLGVLVIGILFTFAFWYLASSQDVRNLGPAIRPDRVIVRLIELSEEDQFRSDYLASLWRVLLSCSLGALVAIPVGVLIGGSTVLDLLTRSILYTLQSIPIVVLGLIFLLIFGPTHAEAVAFVALAVCLNLVPGVAAAVRAVEVNYLRIGRSVGLGRARLVKDIIMPTIRPAILDGLRSGWIVAWSFMAFAEVMGGDYGLGLRISELSRFNHSTEMFAYITAITLSVIIGDGMLRVLRIATCPWIDRSGA